MKDTFKGYYRPTDAEFQKLWKDALVSVDANVLLDLFRFSTATSDALFGILRSVDSRLWLPHEAALEYHRNLPSVLEKGAAECREVLKALDELEKRLGLAEPHKKRTPPHVGPKELKKFAGAKKALSVEIEISEKALLSQLADHPLKEKIALLFKGRVGQTLTTTEFDQLWKDGKDRYARRQPPGFSDAAKPEPARYGDLVLWRELLKHCKSSNADLILVTNDQKEDWFQIVGSRRLGPRPELIEEFHRETGRRFYLYSVASFMELANKFLKAGVPKDAIDEARAAPTPATAVSPSDASSISGVASSLVTPIAGSLGPAISSSATGPFTHAQDVASFRTVGDSLLGSTSGSFESPLLQILKQNEELYRPAESFLNAQKQIAETLRPFASISQQIADSMRPFENITSMSK